MVRITDGGAMGVEAVKGRDEQILIVDDDSLYVSMLTKLLSKANYQHVTSLTNPADVVELLSRVDFDLMLLDQEMPGMSGLDILQQLSGVPLSERPAVLMITANAHTKLSEQALSLGAWDLLSKPVDADVLLLRIRNLLQLKQYHQQLESENELLLQALNLQKQFNGKQLSLADSVTALPNKMIFMDRLEQAILNSQRSATGVGILRVECAYDTLDLRHEWLQEMIDQMGEIVGHRNMMRNNHYSFLVMLDLLKDQGDVDLILSKIKRCSSDSFRDMRIGVATIWRGEKSAAELLEAVEQRIFEQLPEDFSSLKVQLHQNIYERDGVEFELVWQPQVTSFSRHVVSAEVLLRWSSPLLGAISPDRFIPIAEEEGWIREISRMVVERAIEQYGRWRAQFWVGLRYFSVNLSASDLQDDEIFYTIERALEQYQVPPSQLCIELTESKLMEDVDRGRELLQRFKGLGVKIALDDFGTGYSSLSYLRLFDIDILKLDRSFVADLRENSMSQSIVHALGEMARSLGVEMVVEGVEEQRQLELLQKSHVDLIQGYYYSRPLRAAEFIDYLNLQSQDASVASLLSRTEPAQLLWSEAEYGLGHAELDLQHQTLFSIVNRFVGLIQQEAGEGEFYAALEEVQEYLEFHLLSEELVLKQSQYPRQKEHHECHEGFRHGIRQLMEYHQQLKPAQVYLYLKGILSDHVRDEDRMFREFL